MAAAAGLVRSRNYAARAIHLTMQPYPVSLAETRALHRVMSRYGEVQYFKSQRLDYRPSISGAIVIFKDIEVAQKVLDQKYVDFELEAKDDMSVPALSGPSTQGMSVQTPPPTHGLPQAPAQAPITSFEIPQLENTERQGVKFRVRFNAVESSIERQIEMGPFYGHFEPKRTLVTSSLLPVVPIKAMAATEWRQRGRPGRELQAEKEEARKYEPFSRKLSEFRAEYLRKRGGLELDSG